VICVAGAGAKAASPGETGKGSKIHRAAMLTDIIIKAPQHRITPDLYKTTKSSRLLHRRSGLSSDV